MFVQKSEVFVSHLDVGQPPAVCRARHHLLLSPPRLVPRSLSIYLSTFYLSINYLSIHQPPYAEVRRARRHHLLLSPLL